MKETRFIEQNKKKWAEFDELMKKKQKDADKLSDLFIQLTDDLSYARTFYPHRSVRVFLNNQAQRVFVRIYRNRRSRWKGFLRFWKEELPQVMWFSRREFLLSFLMTALFIAIGVFSSIHDNDFARVILGDRYVAMTEANIESGDPMAVYKEMAETDMFLYITFNNLRVDLLIFILGIFFSIGTVAILLYNGIMIGAFQYFFIERGLFWPSFLTIFQHGTLEVSAMIISGAAGLALGRGLLFPGTYSRLQAFQYGAIRAMKIFAGVIPITIMAGFIEAFVTRHTDVPESIRLGVIVLSLVFIIFYFMILPRRMAVRGFKKKIEPPELRPSSAPPLQAYRIRSTGEVFTDTFRLLRKFTRPAFLFSMIAALLMTITLILEKEVYHHMDLSWTNTLLGIGEILSVFPGMFMNIMHLFDFDHYPQSALLILVLLSSNMLFVLYKSDVIFSQAENPVRSKASAGSFLKKHSFRVIILIALILASGFLPGRAGSLLFWLLLPVFILWIISGVKSQFGGFDSLSHMFITVAQHIGRVYLLYLILLLICTMLLIVIGSPLTYLYLSFLQVSLPESLLRNTMVYNAGYIFLLSLVLNIAMIILMSGFTILFYTLSDISQAISIKEQVRKFAGKT